MIGPSDTANSNGGTDLPLSAAEASIALLTASILFLPTARYADSGPMPTATSTSSPSSLRGPSSSAGTGMVIVWKVTPAWFAAFHLIPGKSGCFLAAASSFLRPAFHLGSVLHVEARDERQRIGA